MGPSGRDQTTDGPAETAWRIRPATVADARAIVGVRAVTWADTYGHMVTATHLAGLRGEAVERRWAGFITTAAASELAWVAHAGDDVTGFSIGGSSRGAVDVGEVFALYVHPRAQGRGVGSALLDRLEGALARRWSTARLWVFEQNAAARRFYARAGWVDDGVVGATAVSGRAIPKRRLSRTLP